MNRGLKRWLLLLGRLGIAAIFLYAGYEKVREPWIQFAVSIDTFKVAPEAWLPTIAQYLPWFEIILGLWLLLPSAISKWGALVATGMLTFFLGIGIRAAALGLTVDCGCFGAGHSGALDATWFTEHVAMLALGVVVTVFEFLPARNRRGGGYIAPDMVPGD
jgi:uncharacterized membrane protein YphA (DoxX/SURF4 family)